MSCRQASGTPQTIYFLKADDVSYPNSDENTNTKTNIDTNTKTETNKGKTKDNYDVIYFRKGDDKRILNLICHRQGLEICRICRICRNAEYAEYAECAEYAEYEVQSPISPFDLADLFSPKIWSSFLLCLPPVNLTKYELTYIVLHHWCELVLYSRVYIFLCALMFIPLHHCC